MVRSEELDQFVVLAIYCSYELHSNPGVHLTQGASETLNIKPTFMVTSHKGTLS